MSSCDFFALVWSRNGMGPLVGEPTAAGYTAWRLQLPVVAGGVELGVLSMALSYETMGNGHTAIEAVPIPLTVSLPHTFDNTDSYDAELVSAAVNELQRAR